MHQNRFLVVKLPMTYALLTRLILSVPLPRYISSLCTTFYLANRPCWQASTMLSGKLSYCVCLFDWEAVAYGKLSTHVVKSACSHVICSSTQKTWHALRWEHVCEAYAIRLESESNNNYSVAIHLVSLSTMIIKCETTHGIKFPIIQLCLKIFCINGLCCSIPL